MHYQQTLHRSRTAPIVFLLILMGLGWQSFGQTTEFDVSLPRELARGDVLPIMIIPFTGGQIGELSEGRGFSALLRDNEGRIRGSAESFPWIDDAEASGHRNGELILMGIPSSLPSGEYTLQVTASGSGKQGFSITRALTILPGSFKRETIPLNTAMSKLRSEPDPRKVAEAVEIQGIYNHFGRRASSGTFRPRLPVQGYPFSSWYGDRRTYRYSDGEEAFSIHSGVDIAAPTGTDILAGAAGRVIMVRDRIVTGKTVVIEHLPGIYGVFFHLNDTDVEEGALVDSDTVIGTVGMTGLATGPHLHWEMRVSGVPVDPLLLCDQGIVNPAELLSGSPNQDPD